jgi:hypothetical protein
VNRRIVILLMAGAVLVVIMLAMSPGFAIGLGDQKKGSSGEGCVSREG